jgi:cytochrome c556
MPITWRNVNGGNGLGVASRILDRAGDQFQGSLNTLGGLLNSAETNIEDNRVQGVTNNTNAFMDQLAAYNNPEDLQAAEAQLRQQLASYGSAGIDRDRTRGAIESTITGLQQEDTARRNYDFNKAKDAARPLQDQFDALLATGSETGDFSAAEQFALDNQAPFKAADLFGGTMESLQSRQQGYKDQVFANQQRGRTRDQWGREDATLERRGVIDTAIADALTQIESSDPAGMGAQEVRQVLSSALPKDSNGADRLYAAQQVDAALLPYEAKSALDVEMDAEDDALLRSQYDIDNNIFAQDNPYNVGNTVTDFLQNKNIENDGIWGLWNGSQITAPKLMNLVSDGLEYTDEKTGKKKKADITPAMLAMLQESNGSFLGMSDAWGMDELEDALIAFAESPAYNQQFEAYERYKAESTLRAQLRRERNPLRRK